MNLDVTENKLPDLNDLQLEDKWILSKYNDVVKSVTENLDKFELGIALSNLYDFIWENFCDWYIELVKPRLFDKENPTGKTAQYVLTYVLSNTMKLLHPFMPFITEEIWQHLPHEGESIMISEWPEYDEKLNFPKDVESMELIMQSISAIRNRRAEMNVPPSKKAKSASAPPLKTAVWNFRRGISSSIFPLPIFAKRGPALICRLLSLF